MVVDLIMIETPDAPEEWFLRYDREPTVFPRWPRSKAMSIVAVRDISTDEHEDATEAYIVGTPGMLAKLTAPGDDEVSEVFGTLGGETFLFYTVPSSILEREDVVRPLGP